MTTTPGQAEREVCVVTDREECRNRSLGRECQGHLEKVGSLPRQWVWGRETKEKQAFSKEPEDSAAVLAWRAFKRSF